MVQTDKSCLAVKLSKFKILGGGSCSGEDQQRAPSMTWGQSFSSFILFLGVSVFKRDHA